jgi:hypothetical protein
MRRGHLGANPPSAHRALRATPIRRGSLRRSRHCLGRKGHARTRQARQPRLDPVAGIRNLPSIPLKCTGTSLHVGSPVTTTHDRIHQQASPAPMDAEVTLVPRSDPWRRKARHPARDWRSRARRAPRIRGEGEPRRARSPTGCGCAEDLTGAGPAGDGRVAANVRQVPTAVRSRR